MQAYVEDGVLNICPETQEDVTDLKWFLKEFATHGIRMINVVTDPSEEQKSSGDSGRSQQGQNQSYDPSQVESAYGYLPYRGEGGRREDLWYEDIPPFRTRSYYDNRTESDQEIVFPKDREYINRYYVSNRRGGRGNGSSGRGRGR